MGVEVPQKLKAGTTMTDYEFTLRFILPSSDVDMDELVDALYEHGCDDALIGIGQPGRLGLDFTRTAASARRALLSAIADVMKAIPGAALVEVSPDLVGLSDVATIFGRSRQNMRKLILSCPSTAPAPAHEGKSALWHLSSLLRWLEREKQYEISPVLLDVAETTMQVNSAMSSLRSDPETERELRNLLA